MLYTTEFETGLVGRLKLASDGEAVVGCRFEDGPRGRRGELAAEREAAQRADDLPVLVRARDWLRRYFQGERPSPGELPLAPQGSPFRRRVWELLVRIPYGETLTYGEVAARVAAETGRPSSARAVGGAVGANPIGVIVPCHRVVGAGGDLTGFGGGLAAKVALLEHEGADMGALHLPRRPAPWDPSAGEGSSAASAVRR